MGFINIRVTQNIKEINTTSGLYTVVTHNFMNYIVNRKYDGLCWMCNKNRADSREHKDKQSDIKSFMNSIENVHLQVKFPNKFHLKFE